MYVLSDKRSAISSQLSVKSQRLTADGLFLTAYNCTMKDFRQLKVWEKSHQLALAIYKATKAFPKEELYGLTSQIRRASMSIPTNIAEGCGRNTDREFARFLQIAMGSASETEYQLILARDLDFLPNDSYEQLHNEVEEIKRMLASLLKTLRADR
jgi:four helix bundle protein